MAVKGVDISEMNGSVDFGALQAAGVRFVLIRCGYGSDFTHQDDEKFEENVRKADACGMPWGAYLYSYAKNTAMAKSEAAHALRVLNGRKPAYGLWYDVEDGSQAGADLVSICEAFCTAVEAAGVHCGIYSMLSWLEGKLNSSRLDRFDKWVVQWAGACEYRKPYGIWQFTDRLTIGGRQFDGDWAYKDYPALTRSGFKNKKEEENMTEAQTKKIAADAADKAVAAYEKKQAAKNPTYNTLDEVPEYWREDIRALMEDGIIQGTGGGRLGLTHSDCKAAVIVKRALEKK